MHVAPFHSRRLWLVPLLAALACDSSPSSPEPIDALPRELSVTERSLVGASNAFAFDLAGAVSHPDSGFFVSPLSASMALGMAMNGADGETWSQMRATLGFDGLTQQEINRSYQSLTSLLLTLDPTVDVGIGNSVWIRDDFEPFPSFVDTVSYFFDARVESLDFSLPTASERINGWVEDATRGHIDEIVPATIPPAVVLYLVNAIYFQAGWADRFDADLTARAPFTRPDGSVVEVDMMHRPPAVVAVGAGPGYQVAELAYGGGAFAMTIVLPDPWDAIEDVVASLDDTTWSTLIDGLAEREVAVSLPRFEMEYERTLNDDLIAMGMVDAFSDLADFGRLADAPLFIDSVKQKAYVKVDEEGTTAAAATAVGVGLSSAPPEFRVDRPFLFALRERYSGAILFLGKVTDPS